MSLVASARSERKSKIYVKAVAVASKVMAATAVAVSVYKFLAPLAAAERGYTGAVGGEGLLTLAAFWLTYKFFTYVFEKVSE